MADEQARNEATEVVVDVEEAAPAQPSTSAKPRARLGPTEVVILPNSDTEDEDDQDEAAAGEDTGAETDPDFLKNYPVDTEVSHIDSDGEMSR